MAVRVGLLCLVALGSSAAVAAPGPCEQLRAACLQAGFAQGAAEQGIGLIADCVLPLMHGEPQRAQAKKPLPPVAAGLVAACREKNPDFGSQKAAPAATAPARASMLASSPSRADRLVLSPTGEQFYVTGNGVRHFMLKVPIAGGMPSPIPVSMPFSGCPVTSVTPAGALPPRWDLHGVFPGQGIDLMTPVEDQLSRGSCWAFAQVAGLEMEYVAAYARTHSPNDTQKFARGLRLSEQYYLDLTAVMTTGPVYSEWASTPPSPIPAAGMAWPLVAVADPTALNQSCGGTPLLGLPTYADWPYVHRDATRVYSMMKSTPLVRRAKPGFTTVLQPTDSAGFSSALPAGAPAYADGDAWLNGLAYGFNLDLGNFYWSSLAPAKGDPGPSFPPPAVHQKARYAPLAVRFLDAYFADDTGTTDHAPAELLPTGCKLPDGKTPAKYLTEYPIVSSTVMPSMQPSTSQAACYALLAAPYETLLSQNHPVVVTTRPINWTYSSYPLANEDTPSYWDVNNKDWTATSVLAFANHPDDGGTYQTAYPLRKEQDVNQHFVLLIGYDHQKQLFHFKNSWGTGAGTGQGFATKDGQPVPDGTFWMTYDLLFRTLVTLPQYIDGVWDPLGAIASGGQPSPIPTGAFFGFWRGTWAGKAGLAVIGHFPDDSRGSNIFTGRPVGAFGNPGGTFYFQDGSPSIDFQMTRWSVDPGGLTYSAEFSDRGKIPSPLFTLGVAFNPVSPMSTWTSAKSPADRESTWSRCSGTFMAGPTAGTLRGAAPFNVVPASYVDALDDPYVLPPCNDVPWRVEPAWSCKGGDALASYVNYSLGGATGWPPESQVARLCLTPSPAAPSCPAGSALLQDQWTIAGDSAIEADFTPNELRTGSAPVWLDVCVPSGQTCADGGCAVPTCPAPSSSDPAMKIPDLGSAVASGPLPWVQVQSKADTCVAATYAPTARCPAGYTLSPNQDDCLATVIPAPPVRPPPGGKE